MIVVGTATVNSSTGKVDLVAPLGFGTARGVRLSNFTGDTITLTNIAGTSQSQEYLAPQTQMVYSTTNIGATPTAVGTSYSSDQIASNLLIEWSTDPDSDFIGTYPAALPAAISNTNGASVIYSEGNIPTSGAPFVVGSASGVDIPGDNILVLVHVKCANGAGDPGGFLVVVQEATTSVPDVSQAAAGCFIYAGVSGNLSSTNAILSCVVPAKLTHAGKIVVEVIPPSSATVASAAIYSLTNSNIDVPLQYIDLCDPFVFTTTPFTPDPAVSLAAALSPLYSNAAAMTLAAGLAAFSAGEIQATLTQLTSGTGLNTPGFISSNSAQSTLAPDYTTLQAFADAYIIGTTDCYTYTGTTNDLIIGRRAITYNNTGISNFGNMLFIFLTTTDTGNITVDLTLSNNRPTYCIMSESSV